MGRRHITKGTSEAEDLDRDEKMCSVPYTGMSWLYECEQHVNFLL